MAGIPGHRPAATALLIGLLIGLLAVGCGSEDRPAAEPVGGDPAAAGGSNRGAGSERDELLLEGGERLVFIGDSLAVEAPPNYPELLPAALGRRAPGVTVANLAQPGTTAADWLPGTGLFEQGLEPELEGAALVLVTVGGNDLQAALGGADGLDALSRAESGSEDGAFTAIDQLRRRLQRLFGAIRRRAPEVRIVFVGYPDYAKASAWRERGSVTGTVALSIGLEALAGAAERAGPDLMIDMREPTSAAGVDSLLADSEHLGPAGHELYARRLARTLTR